MRTLHHDIHVMNTQLAIYDADSRCLYMQIETVSTCCWEQKAHPVVIITPGYLSCRWQMENVDFLQPLLYTRIMYFNPDFIDTSHITQTGYFVCRWQTLQHLVLIMLDAQLERVTAAVQVYESIVGVCWYSSASLCLKPKSVPTSPHVSAPKIISLKRREALNSGWL